MPEFAPLNARFAQIVRSNTSTTFAPIVGGISWLAPFDPHTILRNILLLLCVLPKRIPSARQPRNADQLVERPIWIIFGSELYRLSAPACMA